MTDTPQHLHRRLTSEQEKTLGFFAQLPEESWQQTIYTEGSCWTLRQVLAHFVSTEESLHRLIKNILAGGAGAPEDFNIDAYNERKVGALNEVAKDELLRLFSHYRQMNATLVESMRLDDLEKTGRHPFLGITSLAEIIKMLYRHNQIHLREIRKALQ